MTGEKWYQEWAEKEETLRRITLREVEDGRALALASNPELWAKIEARNPWEVLEEVGVLPDFLDPEEGRRQATEWLQSKEGQMHLEEARMGLFWEAQR